MNPRVTDALIAIRRILRATEFASRDLSRSSGMTASQMIVLQIIAREGPQSAGKVASSAQLSQATLTALLDKLEEKGLILRGRDQQDGRRVTLTTTAAGHVALEQSPDVLQNLFALRFMNLADWEQAQLVASLERVAALMNAEKIDASPILDVGSLRDGP